MIRFLLAAPLMLALAASACAGGADSDRAEIDRIAESYVRFCLELGLYDTDFVDAYYGPEELRPEPLPEGEERRIPVERLSRRADEMVAGLDAVDLSRLSDIERRRVRFLRAHILSAKARARLVGGEKLTFDEESKALYGVIAPPCDVDSLESAVAGLEKLISGEGELAVRVEKFREYFVVPRELIDKVFSAAIEEARRRTAAHIDLPEGESFDTEYVTGVSWGAYNWYKGDYHSLIQVNVDLPFRIGSPLSLATHEGYPGHHVQNLLVEKNMLRGRGWIEYSVQPLYCPQATINEGGANYAVRVAFTEDEESAFIRDVLFPLAGLDPSRAAEYLEFERLTRRLRGAGTEAVRRYLDGGMTRDEAIAWLRRYSLMSEARADRYLRFGEHYRSYVVTYDVGLKLVRSYILRESEGSDDPQIHWKLLRDLYAIPHLPSDLE
jgi:hypothetical protein